MSSFKELLNESFKKSYYYRVKFAHNCTNEHMDMMEKCLQKYSLETAASFKRTPIQENPTEFVRAKGLKCISEVCSTDIGLKYPANPRILEVWLSVNMGIDVDRVLVYGITEPRSAEADAAQNRLVDDVDREVDPEDALLAEEEYDDGAVNHDDYYGEGHNKKFLDELARIKAEKGENYFRHYPTKDEIMGDNLRPMWDDLNSRPNMGKGETTKETDVIDQSLGH